MSVPDIIPVRIDDMPAPTRQVGSAERIKAQSVAADESDASNMIDHHAGAQSPDDPLVRAQATNRLARWIAGLIVVAALTGAFWPLPPIKIALPEPVEQATPASTGAIASLNVAAFDLPLWIVAATPVAEEKPTAPPAPLPPPPLRIQLLGITRGGTPDAPAYKATIYDPDSDRIIIIAGGDTVGGRTVKSISTDRIAFALGQQVQTLLLRADQVIADPKGGP